MIFRDLKYNYWRDNYLEQLELMLIKIERN